MGRFRGSKLVDLLQPSPTFSSQTTFSSFVKLRLTKLRKLSSVLRPFALGQVKALTQQSPGAYFRATFREPLRLLSKAALI